MPNTLKESLKSTFLTIEEKLEELENSKKIVIERNNSINSYKQLETELRYKLKETSEKYDAIINEFKEVKMQRENQKIKIIELKDLSGELANEKLELTQNICENRKQIDDQRMENDILCKEKTELMHKLTAKVKEIETSEARINSLSLDVDQLKQDKIDLNKHLCKTIDELKRSTNRNVNLEEEIKSQKSTIADLTAYIDAQKLEKKSLFHEKEALKIELDQLKMATREAMNNAKNRMTDMATTIKNDKKEFENLLVTKQNLDNKIQKLQESCEIARKSSIEAQKRLTTQLESAVDSAAEQSKHYLSNIDNLNADNKKKDEVIITLREWLDNLGKENHEKNELLSSQKQECTLQLQRIQDLNTRNTTLSKELNTHQETLKSTQVKLMKSDKSCTGLHEAILQLKEDCSEKLSKQKANDQLVFEEKIKSFQCESDTQMSNLNAALRNAINENQEYKTSIKEMKKKNESLQSEMKSKIQQLSTKSTAFEALKTESSDEIKELKDLQQASATKAIELRDKLSHSEEMVSKLVKEVKLNTDQVSEYEQQMEKVSSLYVKKEGDLNDIKALLLKLKNENEAIDVERNTAVELLRETQTAVTELQERLKTKTTELQNVKEHAAKQISFFNQRNQTLTLDIRTLEKSIVELSNDRNKLVDEQAVKSARIVSELHATKQSAIENIEALKAELDTVKKRSISEKQLLSEKVYKQEVLNGQLSKRCHTMARQLELSEFAQKSAAEKWSGDLSNARLQIKNLESKLMQLSKENQNFHEMETNIAGFWNKFSISNDSNGSSNNRGITTHIHSSAGVNDNHYPSRGQYNNNAKDHNNSSYNTSNHISGRPRTSTAALRRVGTNSSNNNNDNYSISGYDNNSGYHDKMPGMNTTAILRNSTSDLLRMSRRAQETGHVETTNEDVVGGITRGNKDEYETNTTSFSKEISHREEDKSVITEKPEVDSSGSRCSSGSDSTDASSIIDNTSTRIDTIRPLQPETNGNHDIINDNRYTSEENSYEEQSQSARDDWKRKKLIERTAQFLQRRQLITGNTSKSDINSNNSSDNTQKSNLNKFSPKESDCGNYNNCQRNDVVDYKNSKLKPIHNMITNKQQVVMEDGFINRSINDAIQDIIPSNAVPAAMKKISRKKNVLNKLNRHKKKQNRARKTVK